MKKKKYKIKKSGIIVIFVILALTLFLYKPTTSIISLMGKKYSFSTSFKIYKKGLTDDVLKKDYNETFDNAINSSDYKDEYFSNYMNLKYYDYKDFISCVNKLFDVGYLPVTVNIINSKNDMNLIDVLKGKYVEDIDKYLEYNYFKLSNLDRYLKYFNGDYKDTIVKVNIGLDKEFYEDVNVIKDYSYDVIVNKYNKLDENFIPKDIVELDMCSGPSQYLAMDAKKYYDMLCLDATKDGMNLSVTSSYRDYQSQVETYNYYLKTYGENYVKKYVAYPGYSEHQTALALDVKSLNSNIFANSKEYKWMVDNSYKYGFILRYTKENQGISGYNSEAWHFRFVGVDEAIYMHDNNLSYEEYYAMFK